ncbi:hypothetical protein NSPZN2_100092 [Nitrospira defluvii]|uniref:Uncharacterized protein n=1 Tax=Nitrospira defluvii TaxID=330214 RepID=A0ABM8R0A3_9BACT|nr:hypothetical protein NSPZN2_100092 [Nitrospira defluvii]
MDRLDHRRLRDVEEVVVPLEVLVPLLKSCPAKRGFVQLVPLDHGAHGTIEDQDLLPEQGFYFMYRHDYLCLSVSERRAGATDDRDSRWSGHHIGNRLFSASHDRRRALTLPTLADRMPSIVWLEPECTSYGVSDSHSPVVALLLLHLCHRIRG